MSNLLSFNHFSPAFRVIVLFIQNPQIELTSAEIMRKWPDLSEGHSIALRLRHYKRTGMLTCKESEKRLPCGAKALTWAAGPTLLDMLE
jgi:hypothetical protein